MSKSDVLVEKGAHNGMDYWNSSSNFYYKFR